MDRERDAARISGIDWSFFSAGEVGFVFCRHRCAALRNIAARLNRVFSFPSSEGACVGCRWCCCCCFVALVFFVSDGDWGPSAMSSRCVRFFFVKPPRYIHTAVLTCLFVPPFFFFLSFFFRGKQGRNPLQVAGDGNASEGNADMEARFNVRKEFFQQDPRNRTLVLHHPGKSWSK